MPQFLEWNGISKLTEQLLLKIKENSISKLYKRGIVIFNETDPADGLYIIKSGYVKVYQESENGREKTLAILTSGDVLGEMAAFGTRTRSASVKTLEPTEVMFIPQAEFEELLRTIPAFGLKITEIVTERLREANRQIAQQVSYTSRDKILYQLFRLTLQHGINHQKGILIQPRLTHSDIASLAGVARETVSKVFSDLEEEGLITFESRRLIIRDWERLKEKVDLAR